MFCYRFIGRGFSGAPAVSRPGLTEGSHKLVSRMGLTKRSHNWSHHRSHKKVSQNKVSQKKVSQHGLTKGLTTRSHKRRTRKTHWRGAPVGRTGVTMVSQKYGLVRRTGQAQRSNKMGAPGRTEWAHRWPLWLCPYVRKQSRLTHII